MRSHDASSLLGAKELAGVEVSSKGLARKLTAAVAGQVMRDAHAGPDDGPSSLPAFRRTGYLAVSKRDILVVKMKSGLLTMKLSDTVLARASRKEIASLAWDGGKMLSRLAITFSNGVVWEFDVTNASKRSAESVVRALGRKDLLVS
jgi:hypothetical protein